MKNSNYLLYNINVENLSEDLAKISSLYDSFVENFNDYYYELSNCKNYWHTSQSVYFFNSLTEEKRIVSVFCEEFRNIIDLYQYIVDSCDNIGNKIQFNLDNRSLLLKNFNDYVKSINDIINKYNSLDLSFVKEEKDYLLSERDKYILLKEKVISIRDNIIGILDKINEMENEVRIRLSKFAIESIKENSMRFGSVSKKGKSFVDADGLESSLKKMDFFIKEEESILEDIKDIFKETFFNYDTSNMKKLDDVLDSFVHKYGILIKNHKNNSNKLKDVMNRADRTVKKAVASFEGKGVDFDL